MNGAKLVLDVLQLVSRILTARFVDLVDSNLIHLAIYDFSDALVVYIGAGSLEKIVLLLTSPLRQLLHRYVDREEM